MAARREGLRILFLSHYFPPEIGAPQIRMYELAQQLARGGDSVTVLTAFPNYPTGVVQEGYRGRFSMVEHVGEVTVVRRWVYATPNEGFFKRIVNHLSFVATSLTALRKVGRVDVMFVQSPPLLIGLSTLMFSWLKRAPYVFNVSDIWPQSAVELGVLRNPLAIRLAEALERRLYRKAARVTVPTRGMHARLSGRVSPPGKVVLLTNGVDVDVYGPQAPDMDLARRLGLEGRKVFLYAGTHGLSQGLGVILDAARITNDPDILYVLAGEGADKAALVARAEREGLANVRFLPNQRKESMPSFLNLAYAAIITLKPLDVFKAALPSKMFESMAVAQPIIGSLWGEAAELIEQADCGLVAAPGDAVALQQAVAALAADPGRAREMGRNGRAHVVEHFNRAKIALRLRDLLAEAARPRDEARV